MARIRFKDVKHAYPPPKGQEPVYALKEVDQVWEDGSAYALLGPSGCGKTTLLNCISGLLTPSEGEIYFDGQDVTDLPTTERQISQVFQIPVVYDTMTVYDNLAFPLRNRGIAEDVVRQRVEQIADMLELSNRLNKRASGLTADGKQKISLGRGLVRSDVNAILFDEPLTVIDPHLKWQLRSKLKELHQQIGVTMIYVTHDQVEALTFADKVVVMYEGEIVQIGSPQDLFENPEHTFVGYFIGSPGMNFLDCTLEGNVARCNGARIRIDDAVAAKGRGVQGKLELGIRPMHLKLSSEAVEGGVPADIRGIEDQGSCRIVKVALAGKTLRARLPEGASIPEGQAWLVFPPAWTRLFADGRLVK